MQPLIIVGLVEVEDQEELLVITGVKHQVKEILVSHQDLLQLITLLLVGERGLQ